MTSGEGRNPVRVLIVEDNEVNMKLVRILLRNAGYALLEAVNGEEGLEMAQEHLPDLILMDVELPLRDGIAVTRELKADPRTRHIGIIAVTASVMAHQRQTALDAGCIGCITKPLDTRTFASEVARYFKLSQGRADPDSSA